MSPDSYALVMLVLHLATNSAPLLKARPSGSASSGAMLNMALNSSVWPS